MRPPDRHSLWGLTEAAGLPPGRFVSDATGHVALADLAAGSTLGRDPASLRGRTVLLSCDRQLPAALALPQLDGVARRVLLCPPDLAPEHLPAVIAEAGVDTIVSDGTGPAAHPSAGITPAGITPAGITMVACGDAIRPAGPGVRRDQETGHDQETEWLLFTSGTTGRPKLVVHTLASLTGPLQDGPVAAGDAVWSTFYDIRRYGGLQILLRALLGGGSLVLSQQGESPGAFLARAATAGVTHILGTPSHWRRALMSPEIGRLAPRYVRLSGEGADQAILNQLAQTFPGAGLTHAYASTEAGVGFEVTDGREGFPAVLIGTRSGATEIKVADGSLRLRSPRGASRYLGDGGRLADAEGFIDTGDMVIQRGDRCYFAGRREGIINVGGQKVHPEEVEAVINRHPAVHMAQVRGRPSPITGAIVVADVVLRPSAAPVPFEAVRAEILAACRAAFPPHKVPAMLRQVPSLAIAASGKLARTHG